MNKEEYPKNINDYTRYKTSVAFICSRCNKRPVDLLYQYWMGKKHNKKQVCIFCVDELTKGAS